MNGTRSGLQLGFALGLSTLSCVLASSTPLASASETSLTQTTTSTNAPAGSASSHGALAPAAAAPPAREVATTPSADIAVDDAPAPTTTSCTNLIHLGDSTSIGLISASFLPDANDRLSVRYRSVGITNFIPEISGARSMVETLGGQPNATTVAARRRDAGFKGCWVFALGTNDPANVSGDVTALSHRIDGMMKRAGDMPVLWVTSKTLVTHGPYQNANMEGWNHAVRNACSRYPNMRVYDWASEVKDAWYLADGIHPNTAGCKARASGFATALAAAFPSGRPPSATCYVHATPMTSSPPVVAEPLR